MLFQDEQAGRRWEFNGRKYRKFHHNHRTMYGQIHCVIRSLVQEKFGKQKWHDILTGSGLDQVEHFLVFTNYDDAITLRLVDAVSKYLDLPVAKVMHLFGDYFVSYCLAHGYDKMLRALGGDVESFVQNLDSLHSLLSMSYEGMVAPSFRIEHQEDGALILHYYSLRAGFYPVVIGMMEAVGRDLFQQTVKMVVLGQDKEKDSLGRSQEHAFFRVVVDDVLDLPPGLQGGSCDPQRLSSCSAREHTFGKDVTCFVCRRLFVGIDDTQWPKSLTFDARDYCIAYPYNIICDASLCVQQCGVQLRRLCRASILPGTPLGDVCHIVHPCINMTLDSIRKFANNVFILSMQIKDSDKPFLMKGQMMWMPHTRILNFIGSPRFASLNEMRDMDMFIADIPLYDATRPLVLLNQQRMAEIEVAKALDLTTAELKRTSLLLEAEKEKTENLLYRMLPRKVAMQLTRGSRVEAEKFDNVTILFSDIVGFTNIAAACTPMDIVNMLNDLYNRFDSYTNPNKVYKVETIGDAYMVVGGVPEKQTDHAERVANFAMDIFQDANNVVSPATGVPIQIRVGIHSGPVVAGVVGKKKPRYDLFGDTVNTASRMESHGVPGRIHISPTTYKQLFLQGFVFKRRGEIEVKGKGCMTTYFLLGKQYRMLKEPDDEFTSLQQLSTFDKNVKITSQYSAKF